MGCYILKNTGSAHAASHAHCNQPVSLVEAHKIVKNLGSKFGTGATQRMSHGNRSPVDIHNILVHSQLADNCEGLRRKSFIELNKVYLLQLHARFSKNFGNSFYGTDAHDF